MKLVKSAVDQGDMKKSQDIFRSTNRFSLARFFIPAGSFRFFTAISLLQEGREEDALDSFERIKIDSVFYLKSRRNIANIHLENGRWRKAEEVLYDLTKENVFQSADPNTKIIIFRELDRYYRMQARFEDSSKILLKIAEIADDPLPALREHWRTAHGTIPFQIIESGIKTGELLKSDDSRVWLAKSIIALEKNDFKSADEALKVCEETSRNPDAAVFKARVRLSLLSGSEVGLISAIKKLVQLNELKDAELLRLSDDFSVLTGNERFRNEIYSLWNQVDEKDPFFLERYATFLSQNNREKERIEITRKRSESQIAYDAYQKMLLGEKSLPDETRLKNLIQLSEAIGNDEEAMVIAKWGRARYPQSKSFQESVNKISAKLRLISDMGSVSLDLMSRIIESEIEKSGSPNQNNIMADINNIQIPKFEDLTKKSGFQFQYDNGETEIRQMPVALGGGVGLIDYDQDGLLDLFAVQGGVFPHIEEKDQKSRPGDRLFRNIGNFQFQDVTDKLQLPTNSLGFGLGVAVGDVNNDGFPDLFISRFGSYVLYLNDHGKVFVDVTSKWGLDGKRGWPSSAGFADFDNDGDLDLYVCHYVRWDAENPRICRNTETLKYISCNPTSCDAEPDHLFRNDGGRFVDVSEASGITANDREGRGLGVVTSDFDGDGLIDIFVANDKSANFLFRNRGGFQFEELGHLAGVAAGADGSYQAGMGVACGDFNGDSLMDLAVTNYYGESTTLYQNTGNLFFIDRTSATGLASASRLMLGFGISFLDVNNDGRLDLLSTNGHTDDFGDVPYRMPSQLLIGGKSGRWIDATQSSGNAIAKARLGRGLAIGDLDNDGLIDAVLMPQNEPAVLLRNVTKTNNHWLTIRLAGKISNRDGVGAIAHLQTGNRKYHAARFGGGSYQSASDHRLHLAWPDGEKTIDLEVIWPSGRKTKIANPPSDRIIEVDEAGGYTDRSTLPK